MKKILFTLCLIGLGCQFASAQSITLQPNNFSTSQLNQNNFFESTGESVLKLRRTTAGFTGLPFYNDANAWVGGVYLSSLGGSFYSNGSIGLDFVIGTSFNRPLLLRPNSVIVEETLKITPLSFTGTSSDKRQVFVNNLGEIETQSNTNQFMSYSFSAVQAQDYDDQLRRGSGLAWFNTTNIPATMYLPINLPNGVKVTNIRMYVLDNSASNISFSFTKFPHTSTNATSIATAQSNVQSGTIFSINNDANETIDNLANSYYVNISSVGNWTGNTLAFHSLVITYQY